MNFYKTFSASAGSLFHFLGKRWRRLFRYGLEHTRRDSINFIASTLSIVTMLFIGNLIFSLYVIGDNLVLYAHHKADFSVDVRDSSSELEIRALVEELEDQPGVEKINYISKTDALEEFQSLFPKSSLASFLERYDEPNPLPASISIVISDLAYQAAIMDFLEKPEYKHLLSFRDFSATESLDKQLDRNDNILRFSSFFQNLGVSFVILAIIVTALIVFNTISSHLRHHAKEIEIMYLVGASHNMIRIPFFLEAINLALVAVTLTTFLLLVFLWQFGSQSFDIFQNAEIQAVLSNSVSALTGNFFNFFLMNLLLTTGICLITTFFALHRYFKKVYAQA